MPINLHDTFYSILYKMCFKIVGLGAYQSKRTKLLLFLMFLTVNLSCVAALVGGLTDEWSSNTVTIIITILTIVYIFSASLMAAVMYFQDKLIKELYQKIASDWEMLINETEKKILYTYTWQGLILSHACFLYGLFCNLYSGKSIFLPIAMNHLNRTEYSTIIPYYFSRMIIDEEMHCYQLSVHNTIGLGYAGIFYIGFMSNYIVSVNHLCGVYMIVCRKLKIVNQLDEVESIDPGFIEKLIIQNLINVVVKHREAIEGLKLIEQTFSPPFLIFEIMALIIIAIAITLISVPGETFSNTSENVSLYLIAIMYITFIFIMHNVGEQLMQVSINIRSTACSTCWYELPRKAQKMLQMIIIRSSKVDTLTGGSFVPLSLECFGSILKTSWSTAAVLLTAQKK